MAFIVLTFGSTQGSIPLAAAGAAVAIVLVAVVGVLARAPLARVPENTMKFAVGIMLTTFGIFWSTEGAGAHWPGGDAAILGVLAFVILWSAALVALLRARRAAAGDRMRYIAAFGRFWWELHRRRRLALRGRRRGARSCSRRSSQTWWILPPAVAIVLAVSLHRAIPHS